jgi:hypothetical protein
MAWNTAPIDLLDTYRVSHNLQTPTAFTTPLRQALLTNPGIGRHSPTMARKKEKRRISKEQLALAVRKNFNGAAVSEIDVVVELVYKVRNQGKCLRRDGTGIAIEDIDSLFSRENVPHAFNAVGYEELEDIMRLKWRTTLKAFEIEPSAGCRRFVSTGAWRLGH